MLDRLKRLFLGAALKNDELNAEKFSVRWGLPIYSSDAISSIAYAGEEILLVLVPVLFMASYRYFLGCILAILVLLTVLVISYRQTIDAYPQGGGAYGVTTENLGRIPGLVAGAALIIGYILTVAASSAAATAAIYSAFPAAEPYRVLIALAIIFLLTWGNLRGMRESSVLFGTPTYIFIFLVLIMIVCGFVRYFTNPDSIPQEPTYVYTQNLSAFSLFLVLRAFGSGCTALTGVEAVSNAVPSFRDPSTKNAKKVLLLLAVIIFIVFSGISLLAAMYKIMPDPSGQITVIAQIASRVFGSGSIMFYVIQIATVVILALAANTAFAGLPVLLALIASDGYMPRSLKTRGTKLSYSNGILLLLVASAFLVIVFRADTHALLPLYATGVFLSFTLSQIGMCVRWNRLRTPRWQIKAGINGFGALMSGITCVIIAVSKFTAGAWMVLVALPVFVVIMLWIHRHYHRVGQALHIRQDETVTLVNTPPTVKIIIPIASVNRAFLKTLNYALSITSAEIELFHAASSDEDIEAFRQAVEAWNIPGNLIVHVTEYRNYNELLLRHIEEEQEKLAPNQLLTVVMSQLVMKHPWQKLLHNHTSAQIIRKLKRQRNVSVISIPYIFE